MNAFLHHIATCSPRWAYAQGFIRDRMKNWTGDAKTRRLLHSIYNRSGIETRHSVLGDFDSNEVPVLYRCDSEGKVIPPGTGERNAVFARASRELAVQAAAGALRGAPDFSAAQVTHLIFVSCTGFTNPGPDYHIIRELGLRHDVQRFTLGFMGCYAALPALRMAAQFCQADPAAVVLVVSLELCTLHMQIDDKPDNLLANSLFADGAAAALVSARAPQPGRTAYALRGFDSELLPAGESEMAWDIGNTGFNLVLSSYVPEVIGANLQGLLRSLLERRNMNLDDIADWAVHPGGRAILDKVEQSLRLPAAALEASRGVLAAHGNMSSATILYVLKELLEDPRESERSLTLAMAFGPGLTVETAVLERVPCPAAGALLEEASRAS